MKKCMRFMFLVSILVGFLFQSAALALEPMTLHWDLSEWKHKEGSDNKAKVKVSSEGLAISVRVKNYCNVVWQDLPSKARYLSDFTITAEVIEFKSGKYGIGLGNRKSDLVFQISHSEAELRHAGGEKVVYIKSKKIDPVSFPAKISLHYNVESGELIGSINGREVIRGNVEEKTNIPKISSISVASLWGCSLWNSQSGHVTFSSLSVEAR